MLEMTTSKFPGSVRQLASVVLACLTLSVAHAEGFARQQDQNEVHPDIALVKARFVDWALATNPAENARKFADAMNEEGTWPDVDAGAMPHLYRLLDMAVYYARNKPVDSLFVERLLLAYDFWVKENFQTDHWWFNSIGVQLAIGPILLLAEDLLSSEQVEGGLRILERSGLPRGHTGANLVWIAQSYIIRGLVKGNTEMARKGFNAIANEVYLSDYEGIRPDYAFHQHREMLYTGGYGMTFAERVTRFAQLAHGTAFAFPEERLAILSDYLLDGIQWMLAGNKLCYSTTGRNVTRPGAATFSPGIPGRLLAIGAPRKDELQHLIARVDGTGGEFTGNKHFWLSDYTTHRREDFFVSLRIISSRTEATEGMSGEGMKSYHFADGTTFIYRTGDEYEDIFPVWDWNRIPGNTVAQKPIPDYWKKHALSGWAQNTGVETFVGGVSDGEYGVSGMIFSGTVINTPGEIKEKFPEAESRKSWFFFDDEFVALGAGINYSGGHSVYTSINQCISPDDVVVRARSGQQRELDAGTEKLNDTAWVFHDRIGYVFFPDHGNPVYCGREKVSKDRSRINRNHSGTVTCDVFSLWIDHGIDPADDSYQYIVVPGVDVDELAEYSECIPVEVLNNDSKLQAVRHPKLGITGGVFYAPGALNVADLHLTVDSSCFLLLREMKEGVQLAVSHPEKGGVVSLEINRRFAGPEVDWCEERSTSRVTVELSDGEYLGKSVLLFLSSKVEPGLE